ncbi:hypothetical protein [Roseicella sp. DB1501]|nr:hypothetical protein [Roseicella sp. DB1501]
MSAQTLEAWGGAGGYMASLQKDADNIMKFLEDTETLIAEL